MDVSIIIRSYNEERFLFELLTKIHEQRTNYHYETILVDSGSQDNTLNIAKHFPIKIVRIPKEKFSFGYSLNQGISQSNGKFCLFISAHCIPVYDNWINEMIDPFYKNDQIALVYGKQEGNELTKYSEKQIFRKWYPNTASFIQKNPFCNNANASIRKSLWEIQPYNESLTGLEDLEWASKILKTGYFLSYNPKASVYHIHQESFSQIYNRYKREAITLKSVYHEVKFTLFDFFKLSSLNILTDWIHSLKDKEFMYSFFDIIRFRISQFWGTYKGYQLSNNITDQLRERFYYPPKYEEKKKEELVINENL
ncbi:MAG TPA: glycosyltransferase family 2 protein [Candidatus Cloacimonadota bacterium]|nr:glycosyltransferase family 2 protein [Candidatus Cloacimonadota bacterium]